MLRSAKYPKKTVGAGVTPVDPVIVEKQEAKQDEEAVKLERKKLFKAWSKF